MAEAFIKPPKASEVDSLLDEVKSEFRVMVDVLEKVIHVKPNGKEVTSSHKRGDVITYEDADRAAQLVGMGVLAPLDQPAEEAVNPALAAIHDTTNGGAAGGLAVPGPDVETGLSTDAPDSGEKDVI